MANAQHDQNFTTTLVAVSTADGSTPIRLEADPVTGSLLTTSGSIGLFTKSYDYIAVTYPDDVTEVYETYVGGLGGTLQETVTVTYLDSTKANISSASRT
jgi:hypothetical protein